MNKNVLLNPENKRKFVLRIFNAIASRYDLLNHILSLGIDILWRRKAIDLLSPVLGCRILDVATGTGDLGFEASGRKLGLRVVGVDLSKAMIREGIRKRRNKAGHIEFLCGDAECLPFSDGKFGGVTIGFGIRNVADLEVGLREIYRVLSPGGRVMVLEFSRPYFFLIRGLYLFYFKNVLPLIGQIVSRDPKAYRYLYESVMFFPEGIEFCRHLGVAGFCNVIHRRLNFGIASLYLASKN